MALDSPISVDSGVNILQNFDDATAGRSQALYYAAAAQDSVGIDYVLVRDVGVSFPVETEGASGSETDIEFDITINKPTIFAGIAVIDLAWGVESDGSAPATTHYVELEIIHDNGTTETVIGSVTTRSVNVQNPKNYQDKLVCNITRTLFGVGHTLRLKATLNASGDADHLTRMDHDPATAGFETKLWMPVVNLE